MRHATLSCLSAALLSAALSATPALSQETQIDFVLNWKYQGPQSAFFIAKDKGYFSEEGLDVTLDQGEGSAAAITKVASGAYDAGFGDINALIALAADKPEEAPIAVYVLYNNPPFTIAVKSESDIREPKDLEGKTIGGPASDAALQLFPAFAEITGIDASKVEITNMQSNLREQMLARGQVDGVFGYVNTIAFSAKSAGMNPDEDFRFINYGDFGMDLYSNAVVVSKQLAEEHPDAVEGLLRAINRGVKDMIADPDGSVKYVVDREPLLNSEVEAERTVATLKMEMSNPEAETIGLGDVDEARLKRSIDTLVKARDLARAPEVSEIFTDRFLPPLSERPTKIAD
ncbi:ABC transporter substrate-binding protein [Jiella avicenniae]|uniref:ABC transporter substrate-binding protein n=1 Tax=Jiella avicenniae TaxID=2907202 RepID=A0A9X1NYA4_9HYPH|nr:ABC transporter substrate-binding protein [Jiella avicenniae]MCE7027128.1 ABC transporter substrate-binding protein [Jiella avicenniae]